MKLAKLIKTISLGGALMCFSSVGFASVEIWCLTSPCNASNGLNGYSSTSNGITATVSAYAVGDGANDEYFGTPGTFLNSYGGGYGIGPGPAPDHAIDNTDDYNGVDNVQEFALIDFGAGNSIEVQAVRYDYISGDADTTVLAWGAGALNVNTQLAGLKDTELVGAGWTVVSNFDFLDANEDSFQSINNTTNFSSRYWLVGAYNSAFSSAGCDVGGCVEGNDHFKFKAIDGKRTRDTGVPIPGTAALLALGLMLLRTRKTK